MKITVQTRKQRPTIEVDPEVERAWDFLSRIEGEDGLGQILLNLAIARGMKP